MREIAQEFNDKYFNETPSFIYNLDILESHLKLLRKIYKDYKICYAMKANPILVPFIEKFVDKIEVCSGGEFKICQKYKINPEKIFYTGVHKDKKDIFEAYKYGVRNFNAESLQQLRILSNIGNDIRVFIRIANGQFGIDEHFFTEILHQYKNIIIGLHYFAGTSRDNKIELDILKIKDILKKYNFNELEYGVGLGVNYFQNEKLQSDEIKANNLLKIISDIKIPITLELGRFIVAKCGLYAVRVCDIKKNNNTNYAILDGGINHLNYYGQNMGMKIPFLYHFNNNNNNNQKTWCLCGPICSISDVLVRQIELNGLSINDLIFFKNVGAYSSSESHVLLLSRSMPKIYIYSNKTFVLLRDSIDTYQINMKG